MGGCEGSDRSVGTVTAWARAPGAEAWAGRGVRPASVRRPAMAGRAGAHAGTAAVLLRGNRLATQIVSIRLIVNIIQW